MKTLVIFSFLLLNLSSYCQELSYRQFTVKDGLPGAVVYHALQDRNGFIWFATNQGVSRFDGSTFTNYFKENGLPDNEIIKLYLDRYNNVWMISFMGIPSVFHKGAIIRFDHCTGVKDICEDPLTDSLVMIADQHKGNRSFTGYYRSANDPGKWQFSPHFREFQLPHILNWPVVKASSSQKISYYFSLTDRDHYMLCMKTDSAVKRYSFKRSCDREVLPFSGNASSCLTADKKGIVFYTTDSIYYCNFNGQYPVVSLRKLRLMPAESDDVNSLFCENDSTLWICTRNQGLLRVTNFLSPHFTVRSFFNKSFCTAIMKDREKGYWITTYGDGVFYLPNLSFYAISAYPDMAAKNILSIRAVDTTAILAGLADGNILRITYPDLHTQRFPQWAAHNVNNRVMDLWPLGKDSILAATDRSLQLLAKGQSRELGLTSVKALHVGKDNAILVGTAMLAQRRKTATASPEDLFLGRITCLTGLHNRYYWGTLNGVYTCAGKNVAYLGAQYPALRGRISHLDIAPDSALWVSTPQGLAILKNSTLILFQKEQGLLSNICKQVSFDRNTAWVSTDKGIVRIDYHWEQQRLRCRLSGITEEDGLTANDVNQTVPMGKYIWAATARGISFFSKDYMSRSALRPLINISRIMAGNEVVAATDTVLLNHRKSKLLVELSGISYRSGKQIYYEYRLKELDSNWTAITNNIIEFPALPFGQFRFEVRAVDRWGERSDAPGSMIIINTPPYWKTGWFQLCKYLLSILLVGLGFYGLYRLRQQKREREYRLKMKMHDLEIMALRAQMNPHFIFNCLTSIQYHIMREDLKNANTYLHKFSTLIRQTLQHSTSSVIALREEMRILELYLELEKLRLGERMEYRLKVAEHILRQEIFIPAMILQPYVENAIKHGIAPLEDRKGVLSIGISCTDNYVECFIEDNGPGIQVAEQHPPVDAYDHISMGAGITASRIQTLNAIHQHKIKLRIINKKAAGYTDNGTIVHLSFPIKNH